MAVTKDLLRRQDFDMGEVAERVGYGSASTFSTAFNRHVGQSPSRYARGIMVRGDLAASERSRSMDSRLRSKLP